MRNIVRLINLVLGEDHSRNCEGRRYSCTCGYDVKVLDVAERAHAEVSAIKQKSPQRLGENRGGEAADLEG